VSCCAFGAAGAFESTGTPEQEIHHEARRMEADGARGDGRFERGWGIDDQHFGGPCRRGGRVAMPHVLRDVWNERAVTQLAADPGRPGEASAQLERTADDQERPGGAPTAERSPARAYEKRRISNVKLNSMKRLVLASLVTLSVSGGTLAPLVVGPAAAAVGQDMCGRNPFGSGNPPHCLPN
jgi:hypothetical protein